MNIIYRPEIRFADIDSYGIVHNANFLIYFEQSRIALFKKVSEGFSFMVAISLVAVRLLALKSRPVFFEKLYCLWVFKRGQVSWWLTKVRCSNYTTHHFPVLGFWEVWYEFNSLRF